jgi:hypothetical protein
MNRGIDEKMRRREDEKTRRREDEKTRRREDEKTRRREDEKMRWEDEKMRRWEDEKMRRWEDDHNLYFLIVEDFSAGAKLDAPGTPSSGNPAGFLHGSIDNIYVYDSALPDSALHDILLLSSFVFSCVLFHNLCCLISRYVFTWPRTISNVDFSAVLCVCCIVIENKISFVLQSSKERGYGGVRRPWRIRKKNFSAPDSKL